MAIMAQALGGTLAVVAATVDDDPGIAVKASAGELFGWHFKNTTAAAAYVQLFNKAAVTDVTLGTTTPDVSIGIPALGTSTLVLPVGVVFSTGIVAFATTTVTGNTGAAVDATFWYS